MRISDWSSDVCSSDLITQSQLGGTQRHGIVGGAVAGHVTAGVEGHARRPADRRLAIGTFEAYAAFRQPVDMRGLQGRMAGTGQEIGKESGREGGCQEV